VAVVQGCEHFHLFLEHKDFTVHADSKALSCTRQHVCQFDVSDMGFSVLLCSVFCGAYPSKR